MDNSEITYIGKVDHRNKMTKFGIKEKDRTKHMYVIGKTGTGKTTFIENMIVQDIQNGNGIAFIDPHGESAKKLLDYIPEWRLNDVIYLNPGDTDFPVAFNPLEDMGPDKRHLIADGLMSVFEKIWPEAFSGRMTYILNNTMLALLESPDSTMLGVNRMLTDKDYRKKIIANVTDPAVKNAWEELMKWDDKRWSDAIGALVNKVGQFTTNPIIRNIIGQTKSTFDFRKAMDEKKIIIIDLSKGIIGEQNSPLIGAMIITKIYLAAMSRADLSAPELKQVAPFYFYVDEFQNFANESFASILSEARKYKLCLTVANQYIAQMEETIRDAVFGNMGTTVAFRVGPLDAEFMERVFAPVFTQEDLQNIAFGQYYITLQIDGMGSKPFSAQGLGPIAPLPISMRDRVIQASRAQFAKSRDEIEAHVMEWFSPTRAQVVRPDVGRTPAPTRPIQKVAVPPKPIPISAPTPPPFKPKPVAPIPPPQSQPKTSSTLQGLLNKLDDVEVKEVSKPIPQKLDRVASPEKKSALQEALAKAMGGNSPKPEQHPSEQHPRPLREAPPLKEGAPQKTFVKSDVIREVPEDILRKVLE